MTDRSRSSPPDADHEEDGIDHVAEELARAKAEGWDAIVPSALRPDAQWRRNDIYVPLRQALALSAQREQPSSEPATKVIDSLEDFVQEGCSARSEDKHRALKGLDILRRAIASPQPQVEQYHAGLARVSAGLHTMRGYLSSASPNAHDSFLLKLAQGAIDELAVLRTSLQPSSEYRARLEKAAFVEALRPFASLGGPDDGCAAAFHDLEDDVVLYENSGRSITAGDVRRARSLISNYVQPTSAAIRARAASLKEKL